MKNRFLSGFLSIDSFYVNKRFDGDCFRRPKGMFYFRGKYESIAVFVSENQKSLIFNLKFANINSPRV